MENNTTYIASGQFRDGTEIATFDRTREGLESAYEFVSGAANYRITCGGEIVEESDPWEKQEESYVWEGVDESILAEDVVY
jgi:hypothetical protein